MWLMVEFGIEGYEIMMYAFEHWDWVDSRDTIDSDKVQSSFYKWLKSYLIIGYIDIPLDYAKAVLKAFEQSHVYTSDNAGYIWFFNIVVDPILWVITEW